jgi:RNA recognition motif-containing protein
MYGPPSSIPAASGATAHPLGDRLRNPGWDGGQKRNRDELLDNFKRDHAAASKYARVDTQDTTPNLYVSNMTPTTATTDTLCRLFGVHGPLANVKILTPKSDTDRVSGFVCFMTRVDAERAMVELNGRVIDGLPIRVNWSHTPVSLPDMPIYGSISGFVDVFFMQVHPVDKSAVTRTDRDVFNADTTVLFFSSLFLFMKESKRLDDTRRNSHK